MLLEFIFNLRNIFNFFPTAILHLLKFMHLICCTKYPEILLFYFISKLLQLY